MMTRARENKYADASVNRLQKTQIFSNHKKVDKKTSEVGKIFIRIQLYNPLPK